MIIAITGYKGTGKSTAANILRYLSYERKNPFAIMALAQPIKDVGAAVFGWGEREAEGDLKEVVDPQFGISPRRFYQLFGTELMRNGLPGLDPQFKAAVGDNLWCLALEARAVREKIWDIIIPDMRFVNEARFFRAKGNTVILRIHREVAQDAASAHVSEREVDLIQPDIVIENSGSLDDLKINLRQAWDTVMA